MRPLLLFAILLAVAGAGLTACGRDIAPPRPTGDTIPPGTFAAVVAELAVARAQLLPADTAAYRARVSQILALYDVTAEQMRAFAAGYGANEEVVAWAYQLDRARIDSLAGAGILPPAGTEGFEGSAADTLAPAGVTLPATVAAPETAPPAVVTPGDTAPPAVAPPADTAPARTLPAQASPDTAPGP
jgi:hypothetical protein